MPETRSNLDLAIIGGGPAGAAAAITAVRLGAKVVLLEAGDFPRQKVCGEFVSAESLDVLRGLVRDSPEANSVLRDAPTISQARLFLAGKVVSTPLDPPALSVPRYALDILLWNAAQQAGAQAHSNCEVRGIDGDGPFCLDAAVGRFQAASVIVAAGRWSRFRPQIEVPLGRKWIGVKAHFREYEPSTSTDLYFFENGYCGVQPVAGEIVNACAMVRSDCARTLAEAFALHPALARRAKAWQPITEPVTTAPLIYRVPEPVRGNLVFVGDAAGFIDPFVGDGISIALRTGCIAANELQAVFKQPSLLPSAVVAYRNQYELQFAPLLHAATRIRRLLSCAQPLQRVALPLLRLPGVLPYIIRKTRIAR
jgi:flavin-dependent dehydrogenase